MLTQFGSYVIHAAAAEHERMRRRANSFAAVQASVRRHYYQRQRAVFTLVRPRPTTWGQILTAMSPPAVSTLSPTRMNNSLLAATVIELVPLPEAVQFELFPETR